MEKRESPENKIIRRKFPRRAGETYLVGPGRILRIPGPEREREGNFENEVQWSRLRV